MGLIEAKSILENLRDTGMKNLEPFIGILGEKQRQLTEKKNEISIFRQTLSEKTGE